MLVELGPGMVDNLGTLAGTAGSIAVDAVERLDAEREHEATGKIGAGVFAVLSNLLKAFLHFVFVYDLEEQWKDIIAEIEAAARAARGSGGDGLWNIINFLAEIAERME